MNTDGTCLIDVGGGMRDVYGAGVLDCFLDEGISFPRAIGVSAGSGNLVSFLAGQRGRNLRYYEKYAPRPKYMGMKCLLKDGNYFNLEYIYGTMSREGGEDPVDYDALAASPVDFRIAACDARSGKTVFFKKSMIPRDDYRIIMASCCVPAVCRPVEIGGRRFIDGGTAIPIPWKKAFHDGAERIVVILTLRDDDILEPVGHGLLYATLLAKYPKAFRILMNRHKTYNRQVEEILRLEAEGKAVVIAPKDLYGVTNTTRDPELLHKLYEEGYRDAHAKILSGAFGNPHA
ncbi:MAG: patatin family protein [Chordicoccus sp.]